MFRSHAALGQLLVALVHEQNSPYQPQYALHPPPASQAPAAA